MAVEIEAGDIVRLKGSPVQYRVWQIKDGIGSFHVVTKNGRRDRRHNGISGPMTSWELVKKCEFPKITHCQKCGKESPVMIGKRCPECNPFRACTVDGCLGDFVSKPLPHWMNRFVCNACGFEVSR